MPIFILTLIIQVAFVVHVLKTGRNTVWIYVVMLLPLAGIIAYFFMELLPDLMSSNTGRQIKKNVSTSLNPDKDINQAARDYSITDTVENSARLADECLHKDKYQEAKELYSKALTGIHEYDPKLMHGLAQSEYGLGNYQQTKAILDSLIAENPDFKNRDAHLLYAKALDKSGEYTLAIGEYEALHEFHPGPEASYRYAMLLKSQGEQQRANELFNNIIHKANTASKDYHSRYKSWIKKTKDELSK